MKSDMRWIKGCHNLNTGSLGYEIWVQGVLPKCHGSRFWHEPWPMDLGRDN